jgi:AcrR family transcriptional regulator
MEVAVNQTQRTTLLEAMLDQLAENGYDGTSVEAALKRTGILRGEFETEFSDKDECLFAAYDELHRQTIELARSECTADAWPQRMRQGLAVLLTAIAANPQKAIVATRLFPAIRPAAYRRYTELISAFVPLMREGRDYSEASEDLPAEVELLAVGAAEAIIFGEVDAGRAAQLPGMLPEILFSVLVPFIGPERAAEEMRSAAAA